MDFANYHPRMLPLLIERKVFAGDPFFLVDIGCSGGIDGLWRRFGDHLHAVGFDPQQNECARLRASEKNPNVRYEACASGLADDHEFIRRRRHQETSFDRYYNPLQRSSAAAMWSLGGQVQSNVVGEALTNRKVALSDWVRQHDIQNIDFIKIDTDGSDLEATVSCEAVIRPCGVLGFLIETPFTGSAQDTANSFHNIDRFMRRQGFLLYQMDIRRYSRAVLPAEFVYPIPAQTVSGQIDSADAIYLRDGAADDYAKIWGEELSATKLLKLAALYELFQVPDCAAELILRHAARVEPLVDLEALLDRLTPPLNGQRLHYRDYVKLFTDRPESFFPKTTLKTAAKSLFGPILRRIGFR